MFNRIIIIAIVLIFAIGAAYLFRQSLTLILREESLKGEVYTNMVYGYSISISNDWKERYFVEEDDRITSFVYNSSSEIKHNLFSIVVYSSDEWQQTKNEPGFHGNEIIAKNDLFFIYVDSLDNPYIGDEGDEYQRLAGDINNIIRTFKFREGQPGNIQGETKLGYINNLYEEDGKRYLDFDEFQWLSLTDGTCVTNSEDNPYLPVCNPNGFLILNEDQDLETFEIWVTRVNRTSDFDYSETGERIIGYESFINLGEEHFGITPYIIKIKNGIISKITEKYIP